MNDFQAGTVFILNALFTNNIYKHFGISEITSEMYGYRAKDIIEINAEISQDQHINDVNETQGECDYWGWYDFEDQRFTMAYSKRFLLEMCFPGGTEPSEKRGQGKAYRLLITHKK